MFDERELKQVAATVLNVEVDLIDADSSTNTVSEWDSLKHLDLILAIEEKFKVSIPDEVAANMTSYPLVRSAVAEILEKNDGLAS